MYITEDTGDIYVDISNSKRIQLNADSANKIRKINASGVELNLTYDDIKSKLNSKNPVISGYVTIDKAKLLTDGDSNILYLNSSSGTGNYQGAIATQNYVDNQVSGKWTNNSETITISGVVLDADATDGEGTLTIATKKYVEAQIEDMATKSYVTTEIAKIPTILSGETEPDDEDGEVGDIYIQLAVGG